LLRIIGKNILQATELSFVYSPIYVPSNQDSE
jgi:hypothetical protein